MWVWSIAWVVETCVIGTAGYYLEDVAMKMERVFPRIIVVQHNLHDFVLSKYKGVCVTSVDGWVCSVGTSGKDGV